MERHKVLLTGFEPFHDHDTNESSDVVQEIVKTGIEGIQITYCILSVDLKGSQKPYEMMESQRFDAVLHLGLSSKSTKINLERYARNKISMEYPDNSGRKLVNEKIERNSPEILETTVSVHNFDEEFDSDEDVEWSQDAGSYVCNETYFRTLTRNLKIPVLFMHLPKSEYVSLERQTEVASRALKLMLNRPKIVVVGAMLRDSKNRIFSCMRPDGDVWAGWWEFPGGKVEEGESLTGALRREIEEELEISVTPKSKICEIKYSYKDRDVELHIFDCGIVNGNEISLKEHEDSRWLTQHELLDVKWLPADLPTIEDWHLNGIPDPTRGP